MMTMQQSLAELVRTGRITRDTALALLFPSRRPGATTLSKAL
jgi:Tfp pilus assembly pilus retraction ATPase PilT